MMNRIYQLHIIYNYLFFYYETPHVVMDEV